MDKKGGNKPKREKLPRSAVIINIVMSVIILAICAVFFLVAYGKMKNGL
ncbi:MAG: hypothetical protein NC299_04130 [Lachnospiraceae bacterium]|nr:hypothetical protein [Ruminococcus sp.]MCM1274535.1 hypothetical protein [Lachnospiraceae bacterium]